MFKTIKLFAFSYKDAVTVNDINTSEYPNENTEFYRTGWIKLLSLRTSDISAAVYDLSNMRSDAFSMEEMECY
ncbi:hypothetical protein [Bartonella schoenbuchensis]|nr:hypothetical protein [Bartonella schoenbuchensis]